MCPLRRGRSFLGSVPVVHLPHATSVGVFCSDTRTRLEALPLSGRALFVRVTSTPHGHWATGGRLGRTLTQDPTRSRPGGRLLLVLTVTRYRGPHPKP